MYSKSFLLAGMVATALASQAGAADMPVKAPPAPPLLPFFLVNDNSITYRYEFTATNPGAGKTPKHVVSFSHFDVWAYGTNFFNIDWLKATNAKAPPFGTPAAPCDAGGPLDPPGSTRCDAYTEIYALVRNTFGWNQIFNTKAFAFGPLTNIEFAVGADVNTDNTTLGSAKRSIQGGLQFDFSAPYKGFLNVGFYAYKEWQNDGFASAFPFQPIPNPSGKVDFDTTWAVEVLYVQPLGFLPPSIPLLFKSLLVMHGDKGCGEVCNTLGPGLVRTTEYLTQQTLSLDVGQMLWGKEKMFAIFGAYRYWKNKFGIDPDQPFGQFGFTTESTFVAGATAAF
jgi:nucleoside-specific outer membrane channel protein Tsx